MMTTYDYAESGSHYASLWKRHVSKWAGGRIKDVATQNEQVGR